MFIIRIITVLLICGFGSFPVAQAKSTDANQALRTYYSQFERLVEKDEHIEQLAKFLHETIDERAVLKIQAAQAGDQAGAVKQKITKVEYINSYIYGPRMVENYNMDIEVVSVDAQNAYDVSALIRYTESGYVKSIYRQGDIAPKFFTTTTTCNVVHEIKDSQKVTVKKSDCTSSISEDEFI